MWENIRKTTVLTRVLGSLITRRRESLESVLTDSAELSIK